jgi:transcriptional regulator
MYVPGHFSPPDEAAVSQLLQRAGISDLVVRTADGLQAATVPFLFDPSAGDRGSLMGHLARANRVWSDATDDEVLVIVHGPDAYVSPAWYESTKEHGQVVPTWNYVTVQVHGRLVVHDDPFWTADLVERLTNHHEAGLDPRWWVADAPEEFIAKQLKAIVGIEVAITRIEGKWKLSQNRTPEDFAGVVTNLSGGGESQRAVAAAMAALPPRH